MGDGPERNFLEVPLGRDIQGEQNIIGTGNVFEEFLLGGARGNNQFDETLENFRQPLGMLQSLLRGELTGAAKPLFTTALEDTLSAQSNARQELEGFLSGTRPQFGADRLRAQLIQGQSRDRGRLRTDLINNFINTLLPVLGQAVGAQQARAGVAGTALAGSQQFNRTSQGAQAQAQNRAIAGQPPQGKDASGTGALVGTLLPVIGGAALGPLAGVGAAQGALSGLGLGTLNLGKKSGSGLNLTPQFGSVS